MQPKTEEFLYFLLWSAEQLTQPTFRNLTGSFESWAYRNGLRRQIARLEKEQFLQRKKIAGDARIYRLTARGRLHALGGRDPNVQWARPWDGRWRLLLFDVPVGQDAARSRLRRYLQRRHFGYLQQSVWLVPDPMAEEIAILRGAKIDVEALLLLEAIPGAGESDAQIVAGAWDFTRINKLYRQYLTVANTQPAGKRDETAARKLRRWATAENAAWLKAVNSDPLLPQRLLPADYLGQKAWERRIAVLGKAGRDLLSFRLPRARKESW